jgi:hypothetical protein
VDIRESVVVAQETSGCPATGVQNQGSTYRVFGGELQSTRYAIANSGAPPAVIVVHHAALRGDVNVISNGANFTTQIGASQLNGPGAQPHRVDLCGVLRRQLQRGGDELPVKRRL